MRGRGPNSSEKSPFWIEISWASGRCGGTRIQRIPGLKTGLLKKDSLLRVIRKGSAATTGVRTVYFDYNATTPLDHEVRRAMLPLLEEVWGNPSSVHRVGRQARSILDEARERAAQVLGCKPSEITFTSGGTESANLAILGTARRFRHKGRHLITSVVEHHAVLHSCEYLSKNEGFEVTYLPVSSEGRVSPESLIQAIRPDTI